MGCWLILEAFLRGSYPEDDNDINPFEGLIIGS
jgi:hypothetical protein